jgi:D-lactate dehydrogenase (cytochrome)
MMVGDKAAAFVIHKLEEILGDRITTNPVICRAHGQGEAYAATMVPNAVAYPRTTEELVQVVRACAIAKVPLIPFGAGTSLEGQVQAVFGGISCDLSQMDRILEINRDDLDCRVQAGVTRERLNQELRDTGLFFPVDPGANATLGGMVSTRASGTNAVRYGTMRHVTLGLTIVLADGEVISTGGRARKSAMGYDLTALFVGAEGTLGIVTEVQLKLTPIPETITVCLCQFRDLQSAVSATIEAIQSGLPLARIELLDALQMRASIAFSKLAELNPQPTLFFELHGSPETMARDVRVLTQICGGFSPQPFRFAETTEARNRLWQARHQAYYAARSLAPGAQSLATDACVPISALAACIAQASAAAEKSGLLCPIVGHVGDGNFHMLILYNSDDAGECERAHALCKDVSRLALYFGGTCSGEHGVGLHKLDEMELEHGPALAVMQRIKHALDPDCIMNPGKLVTG